MPHWTWIRCISIIRNKNCIIPTTTTNWWDKTLGFWKRRFIKRTHRSFQNKNLCHYICQWVSTDKYNCLIVFCDDAYYFPPDKTDSFPPEIDGAYIDAMLKKMINVSGFLNKKCATILTAGLLHFLGKKIFHPKTLNLVYIIFSMKITTTQHFSFS